MPAKLSTAVALAAAFGLMAAGDASAELAYGVTANGTLISFDTATPGTVVGGVAIQGLESNEVLRGIDIRPLTGQLYGLGSFNNLYTVNPGTGQATIVGSGFTNTLNGSAFGFDFNPVIDKIRVVSDADQNLVLDPDLGTSTPVTSLFYGPGDANEGTDPNVVNSAYTNSVANAPSTQLYGIDTGIALGQDILVTQANSAGTLGTVGTLGADISSVGGFDISGATGDAFVVEELTVNSVSRLWQIDLNTGQGTLIGEIAGGTSITAFTVVPEPGSAALLALGGLALIRRRRSR